MSFYSHKRLLMFLSVLIVIVVYRPSFHAPFQGDDQSVIVGNPHIRILNNFGDIWQWDPSRFLTHVSFAMNYAVGKLNPLGYHIFNFMIHLFNGFLVYLLIQKICYFQKDLYPSAAPDPWFAGIGALVFLLHPIQTSSVSYVVQRSVLLATFFYLLSVLFYLYANKNKKYYYFSLFAAAGGVFCKPIIVTLPLILILCDVFFVEMKSLSLKRLIRKVGPFVLIVACVPFLLVLWRHKQFDLSFIARATYQTTDITRQTYLLTQFHVIFTYIRLLFFPICLNFDYDYPLIHQFFNILTILKFFLLVGIVFVAVKQYRRNHLIAFGLFWFFMTLSLESSFFPIKDVIFEHRLYLPLLGFVFVFVSLMEKVIPHRKVFRILMVAVIFFCSILTYQRNLVWSDKFDFLEDVIKKSPQKARPFYMLGNAYYEQGMYQLALANYDKVLLLDPEYVEAYVTRGNIQSFGKEYGKAIENYSQAIALKPSCLGYTNRARVYSQTGQDTKALADYQKAIEVDEACVDAYMSRGVYYGSRGQYESAIKSFTETIKFIPNYGAAYFNRSRAYRELRNFERAYEDMLKAKECGFRINEQDLYYLKRQIVR